MLQCKCCNASWKVSLREWPPVLRVCCKLREHIAKCNIIGTRVETRVTTLFNLQLHYCCMASYVQGNVVPVYLALKLKRTTFQFCYLTHNHVAMQVEKRRCAYYRPYCKLRQHDAWIRKRLQSLLLRLNRNFWPWFVWEKVVIQNDISSTLYWSFSF